jgi:hypothetical protein
MGYRSYTGQYIGQKFGRVANVDLSVGATEDLWRLIIAVIRNTKFKGNETIATYQFGHSGAQDYLHQIV